MRLRYDPLDGFSPEDANPTHEVPDSEFAAYRKLVDTANQLEDRFVETYRLKIDEYASVRGLLTDEQIETLRGLGIHMDDVPAGKVYHEAPLVQRQAISVEQAAQEIIQRNAHKCQHRHQAGPFADGTVRCRDCGGIIYGGTGVKKTVNQADESDFHNPGRVNPSDYDGTV